MTKSLFLILILATCLISCGEETHEDAVTLYEVEEVPEQPSVIDLYTPEIDSVLTGMSPSDKLAQLIWLSNMSSNIEEVHLPHLGAINFDLKRSILDSSNTQYFFSEGIGYGFREELKIKDLQHIMDSTFWSDFRSFQTEFASKNNLFSIFLDTLELDSNVHNDIQLMNEAFVDSNYSRICLGYQGKDSLIIKVRDSARFNIVMNQDSLLKNDFHCTVNLLNEIKRDIDSIQDDFLRKVVLGSFDGYWLDASKIDIGLDEILKTLTSSPTILSNYKEELLDYKVRKIIAVKQEWKKLNVLEVSKNLDIETKKLIHQSKYKSITVLNNQDGILPIQNYPESKWRYVNISNSYATSFRKGIELYGEISENRTKLSKFSLIQLNHSPAIVLLRQQLDSTSGFEFADKVLSHNKNYKTIVVNFGFSENLKFLKDLPSLIHVPVDDMEHLNAVAQSIMGGNKMNGYVLSADTVKKQIATIKTRLSYTIAEEVGIHSDSIKQIDKIAAEAIWGGVAPGCQVFVAKDGKVILNKGYGYHTYAREQKVNTKTVYDLASVTKIAATTLCGMYMYDKGYFNVSDSLYKHLPDSLHEDLGHFSRLHNVTFQRLFTHTSGLPAGLPIYKYYTYTNDSVGTFDKYYCDEPNDYFKVKVAKDFYIDSSWLDTMWLEMNNIWTGTKKYKYSDANMNVLYQIFRSKLNRDQQYHLYLDSVFYAPLKLQATTFLPLNYLDTLTHPITPTENETYWRHQLLKGYVHDQNAAMYGGVAGNAGLFSNAHDLGIIMQMLLNEGSYGGKRYIKPQTVRRFSRHQEGCHRGLGFDKPTATSGNVVAPDCPYTAYGHTGFTGICAWNDPENQLTFVFTSNRVHPNANNKKIITYGVRKRMHQVLYNQLYQAGAYKNKSTLNVPLTRK